LINWILCFFLKHTFNEEHYGEMIVKSNMNMWDSPIFCERCNNTHPLHDFRFDGPALLKKYDAPIKADIPRRSRKRKRNKFH